MAELCQDVTIKPKPKRIDLKSWCFGDAERGTCYTSLQCGNYVDLIIEVEWEGYTKANVKLKCNDTVLIDEDVDLGADSGYSFIVAYDIPTDDLITNCGMDCYSSGTINYCVEVVGK